ncbi:MAG: GNAT family N-acetyltransferase, partial [Lawsonibacter sp.]|nr:GNAT family N-acetyltransferase [Lawsonibacter sp.]
MEEGDLIRRIIGKEAGQMVDIRPSRPGEIPAQKALWKTAFGDEDRLIDWFYDCCMPEEDMLLLLEDGRLASMLALLPVSLSLPGGVEASGRYVYALATDPSMRGKGYGRQLLHYVDGFLSSRGSDCVTVVPAEPSLHKFFATVA